MCESNIFTTDPFFCHHDICLCLLLLNLLPNLVFVLHVWCNLTQKKKHERDKNAINIFLNSFCWDWWWSLLSFYVIQIYLIFVVCADKIYKSDKFFQGRGVFKDKLASCFTCEMCDTLFCGLKGEEEGVVSFYWIIYFKFMCNFDTKMCV